MAANEKQQWIGEGCGENVKPGEFSYLSDGKEGIICRDCVAALRCKYPVSVERNPKYKLSINPFDDDGSLPYIRVCPIQNLTAKQVKLELATVDAYREKLRNSFGGAENVFEVRLVHPLPKLNPYHVNFPNAMRYKNSVAVYGNVRLGIFHKGDIVELCHGNATHDTTVLLIQDGNVFPEENDPLFKFRSPDSDKCFHFEKDGVSEGFSAIMLLPPDAVGIEPGDLIIAD